MSNDDKRTREWVDALLAKAAAGELGLVREKRLRGPLAWKETAEDDFVAVYPKTAEARSWLIDSDNEVNRSGRVEPKGTFLGKYYLRNGAEAETKQRNTLLSTDGFGAHRPYAMNPLPADFYATFAAVLPEENTGGHTHALVLAIPPAKQADALGWLRKEGFLAKTDGEVLHYAAHTNRSTKTSVLVVPVPEALAASVMANPHHTLLPPLDRPPLDLDALASEAAAAIRLPEKEQTVAEKKAKPAPAEPPPLPSLTSAKEELIAIGLEVQEQPQWNGGIQRRLLVPRGQTLKPYLSTDSISAKRFTDPLKLGAREVPPEGGESYSISKEEYARLTDMVGALPVRERLPLDTAPLNRLFNKKPYKNIKPLNPPPVQQGKKPEQGIGINHVMFAHVKSRATGVADSYVVYVAADHKQRLTDFVSSLQMTGREHTLNGEKERPCLIRMQLEADAWRLLKEKAEAEAAAGKTSVQVFDVGFSLQAFDNEARDIAGVHRVSEKEIAPEPAKKQEQNKAKGADAIQFLAEKLSERALANGTVGELKLAQGNLRVVDVQRTDASGKPTRVDRVLVVRAKVNQLNGLVRALRNQTEDFGDSTVRLIAGSKNDGASLGVLEIVLPETAGSAIEACRGETLARHETTLHQSTYKQQIAEHFTAREKAQQEDDAHRKAWEVLARTAFEPVRVSAPNEMKLARIDHVVMQLRQFKAEVEKPEAQLEAWRTQFGEALGAMRKASDDEVFEDYLLDALRDINSLKHKLEQGVLTKIDKRLKALQTERQKLITLGTHLEYVVLNPSQEVRRALEVLKHPLLREVIDTSSNALRIVPAQLAEWSKALNAHGIRTDSRTAPTIALDALDSWIRDTRAEQEAAAEAAQKEKAAQASATHLSATPGMVVSAVQPQTGTAKPAAATAPKPRMRRGFALGETITKASKATTGFLAWEAPFVHDNNVPTQYDIKPQPVLVLSAKTREEVEAITTLYDTLKEEGFLLEKPQFYGEIKHTSKLQAMKNKNAVRDDSAYGTLETLYTHIDTIKARLPNLRYALKDGMGYSDEMASVRDALHEYENHNGMVAQAADAEWMKLLKEALREPHADTVQRCERLINQRLMDMQYDLNQLSGERQKTSQRKENAYVISVRESAPLFFAVDTKEGRTAEGKQAMQLDTWRHMAANQKGVQALKLYIAPDKLEALEQLMEGRAGFTSVLHTTQHEPLLPDQIVDRAHMMQVSGLEAVRARTQGSDRSR